jgi:hypothetical protein
MGETERHPEPHITASDLRGALTPARARRQPRTLLEGRQEASAGRPWTWNAGLSDGERDELDALREEARRLRAERDEARGDLAAGERREGALRLGLRELVDARPWRRRAVIADLRRRRLL